MAGYLTLYESGELQERAAKARELLADCRLCPRTCRVNRLENQLGVCQTGARAVVSSYSPHFGEEAPLVGSGGSGTIFFTHCNLLCVFCQNFEISHQGAGVEVSDGQLAAIMVSLQKQGCHNINFVTPSHVVPQILSALPGAVEKGLRVPLVYNSSAYDSVGTLRLLAGVIDIYLPDFKFWSSTSAQRYAKAPDYPGRAREAIKEMHRQAGDLVIDSSGIATRGLLVRHLVMPGALGETGQIMNWLAGEISLDTYVNIMEQYRPCGQAFNYPPIHRPLEHPEYEEAIRLARKSGLKRLDNRNLERLLGQLGF